MVVERAELRIATGREQEFEQGFAAAGAHIRGANGCLGLTLSRGIEDRSKYLLLVEWQQIEDHHAFAQTEALKEFRALVGEFFAGKPSTEHFSPVVRM